MAEDETLVAPSLEHVAVAQAGANGDDPLVEKVGLVYAFEAGNEGADLVADIVVIPEVGSNLRQPKGKSRVEKLLENAGGLVGDTGFEPVGDVSSYL